MLELLFGEAEAQVRNGYLPAPLGRIPINGVTVRTTIKQAIEELKTRLQQNDIGFVYSNGFLHFANDQLTAQRIAQPFWEVVADAKWTTVDQEMKEAFDRLDHGHDDAFTHAFDAPESTMKIISDEKGWTTGNEKGAVRDSASFNVQLSDYAAQDRGRRIINVQDWTRTPCCPSISQNTPNASSRNLAQAPRRRLDDILLVPFLHLDTQ